MESGTPVGSQADGWEPIYPLSVRRRWLLEKPLGQEHGGEATRLRRFSSAFALDEKR
jgi:hypothetical protein